jgi:hypothetical protein
MRASTGSDTRRGAHAAKRGARLAAFVAMLVTACTMIVGVVGVSAASAATNGILSSGARLNPGQGISTSNGYTLVMQTDGNLVASNPSHSPIWNSVTSGQSGNYAVMQTDGNLVVYSSAGAWRWQSGTNGFNGAYTALQSDGNLVVYSAAGTALWGLTGVSPQTYAQEIMFRYGWTVASQYSSLNSLWTKESGWRWNALNSSSGAYGIPQALPGNKMAANGPDWNAPSSSSGFTQIRWGLDYIKGRYGTPAAAWQHELSYNWY